MRTSGLVLALVAATACGENDPLSSRNEPATEEPAPVRDSGARDANRLPVEEDPDPAKAPVRDAGTPSTGVSSGGTGVCESIQITSGRVLPDMLIVLDRSGSMKSGNVNRWDPSVSGITSITAMLDSQVRFGLMAFPGGDGRNDGRAQRCAAGTLEVPIDLHNGAAIGAKLQTLQLENSTPTAPTLEAAHKVLNELGGSIDVGVKSPPYVVLVTDGAPNCSDMLGGLARFDQQALDQSIDAIEAMAKDGIKTYVVGYDAASDPQLKTSLDAMARAGATGDTEHREISDEASLVTAFKSITGSAVSCDFQLEEAPSDPSYVLVKLGANQLAYEDPNGWILSADRRTLTLQGTACSDLNDIQINAVHVEVQCTPVL